MSTARHERSTNVQTDSLAEFGATLELAAIPDDVKKAARDHILDTIGVSLACAGQPYMQILERSASSSDTRAGSRVLGTSGTYRPQVAGLLNGSLSHGNDYDDSYIEGIAHPTGAVLAAASSVLAPGGISGADLLVAVVAGVEVTCRVARAVGPSLLAKGVHPTSACGVLGATVAAGRAARLDGATLSNALALAAATAGGLHQSTIDGSWNKRIHGGLAARAAIACCQLAQAGMAAPHDVLEQGRGFLRTFGVDDQSLASVAADLGSQWLADKVAIKVYPACQGVHPYVDCAIDIHRRGTVDIRDVRSIDVTIGREVGLLLCEPPAERRRPTNGMAAKFSLPYTVAYALRHGRLPEAAFDWSTPAEEEVLKLAARVDWTVDAEFDKGMAQRGHVAVTTEAGRRTVADIEFSRGTWQNPLSTPEVEEKFDDNAGRRLGGRARTVIDLVSEIDRMASLDQLFNAAELDRSAPLAPATSGSRPADTVLAPQSAAVSPRSLAHTLAAFAASADPVPQSVVDIVKSELLLALTAGLAGARTGQPDVVARAWRPSQVTVATGYAPEGQPEFAGYAAFYTAASVYAGSPARTASELTTRAVIVPALCASRPWADFTGAEFVSALAVATEIVCRLGSMLAEPLKARQVPAYTVLGPLSAAVAVARAAGGSARELANAIAVAGSLACGIGEADGDGTGPYLAGWAAQSGLLAGELAVGGFTGPAEAIEGQRGLLMAFSGSRERPVGDAVAGLGSEWRLLGHYTAKPLTSTTAQLHAQLGCVPDSAENLLDSFQHFERSTNLGWLSKVLVA
jgi:2-methylcitrate dehydratase PrpD